MTEWNFTFKATLLPEGITETIFVTVCDEDPTDAGDAAHEIAAERACLMFMAEEHEIALEETV